MRTTISLVLLLFYLTASSQRVSFDDPDLNFSFKKPRSWELIDDGYVVKISPTLQDTAELFMTITYFEAPSLFGTSTNPDLPQVIPFDSPNEDYGTVKDEGTIQINKVQAQYSTTHITKGSMMIEIRNYQFSKLGQSWELVTSSPTDVSKSSSKQFNRILKSLRITTK